MSLEKWETGTKIVANIATALILPAVAGFGIYMNSQIQAESARLNQEIQAKSAQLTRDLQAQQNNARLLDSALAILEAPRSETTKVPRPWAATMLEKFAPPEAKLDEATLEQLRKGEIQLPAGLSRKLINEVYDHLQEDAINDQAAMGGTYLPRKRNGLGKTLQEAKKAVDDKASLRERTDGP